MVHFVRRLRVIFRRTLKSSFWFKNPVVRRPSVTDPVSVIAFFGR